jgi:hypothetical protein
MAQVRETMDDRRWVWCTPPQGEAGTGPDPVSPEHHRRVLTPGRLPPSLHEEPVPNAQARAKTCSTAFCGGGAEHDRLAN